MPPFTPQELVAAVIEAIRESGFTAQLVSPVRQHPRRFLITGDDKSNLLSVYAWRLTPGGRPSLRNEYRIQMTSVTSPLELATDGPTVLVGYEPNSQLFAGFDLQRHRTFTAGSPSVQIDIEELRHAEIAGLSFHRKTNAEIAVGVRSDLFMTYAMNAELLHRLGRDANVQRLLSEAADLREIPEPDVAVLTQDRQRVVREISRLSRLASFRQQVLFAYGNRCAVTRTQLRLVDAAHILPVGAPGSTDHVRNGIALSPTYHRAYDAGIIFLDDQYRMRVNESQMRALEQLNLSSGMEAFEAPLGQIFLPPDLNQRPSIELIRRANRFRQVRR